MSRERTFRAVVVALAAAAALASALGFADALPDPGDYGGRAIATLGIVCSVAWIIVPLAIINEIDNRRERQQRQAKFERDYEAWARGERNLPPALPRYRRGR